jgi:hypothetical protein
VSAALGANQQQAQDSGLRPPLGEAGGGVWEEVVQREHYGGEVMAKKLPSLINGIEYRLDSVQAEYVPAPIGVKYRHIQL